MASDPRVEVRAKPFSLGLFGSFAELWSYRDLLRHLVGRQLKVKYKRSTLGWVWSLANPLLVAGVFTLVFSIFLRINPPVGENTGLHSFALFLLCALLPWNFLSNVLTQGTVAVVGGADLVKKVYFPRVVLVLGEVLAILVSFMIELLVLMALLIIAGARPGGSLLALPLLIGIQVLFVTGLGSLMASLNVFFRDLQHLLGILLMIWFYATPVIYPPSQIPAEARIFGVSIPARALINLNPMAAFVEAYRDVFYHARWPQIGTIGYLFVVSLTLFLGCYVFFRKVEPRFAEEV